jgi:hypothetical protein
MPVIDNKSVSVSLEAAPLSRQAGLKSVRSGRRERRIGGTTFLNTRRDAIDNPLRLSDSGAHMRGPSGSLFPIPQ